MNKTYRDKPAGFFVIVFFTVLISLLAYLVISNSPISLFPNRNDLPELTITNLELTIGDASTGMIIVHVINSGDYEVTVSEIKVNNDTATSWETPNLATLIIGETKTFSVTHEISAGTKYMIRLFTTEGYLIGSYTKTA